MGRVLGWIGAVVFVLLVVRELVDQPRVHFARAAGWGAVSCGMLPLGADAAAAILCADEALRAGRSFYVGTQVMGMDSTMWVGFAKPDDGPLRSLLYDSDIMGSDLPFVRRSRLTIGLCPRPRFIATRHGARTRCSPITGMPLEAREWVVPFARRSSTERANPDAREHAD